MKRSKIIVYADGGARGNPGPAAAGYAITDEKGQLLDEGGLWLGRATNNQAEYRAVCLVLEKALALQPKVLEVNLDSELIVRQLEGRYRVKNKDLLPLFERVKGLLGKFEQVTVRHVPRAQNKLADRQVNLVLDSRHK